MQQIGRTADRKISWLLARGTPDRDIREKFPKKKENGDCGTRIRRFLAKKRNGVAMEKKGQGKNLEKRIPRGALQRH